MRHKNATSIDIFSGILLSTVVQLLTTSTELAGAGSRSGTDRMSGSVGHVEPFSAGREIFDVVYYFSYGTLTSCRPGQQRYEKPR